MKKYITKTLLGRELKIFNGGFIFDEGGTRVLEINTYKFYKVSTLFRVALYFWNGWFPFGSYWRFAIFKNKPFVSFQCGFYKLKKLENINNGK